MGKEPKIIAGVAIMILILLLFLAITYREITKNYTFINTPAPVENPNGEDQQTILPNPTPVDKNLNPLTIEEPADREITISADEYEIRGTNSPNVTAIELEITNSKNDKIKIAVDLDHKGKETWNYKLNTNNTSMALGENTIIITAYQDNKLLQGIGRTINKEAESLTVNTDSIKVNWDTELTNFREDCSTGGCANYYKAGTVADGELTGSPLYLYTYTDGPGGPYFSHIIIKDGKEADLEKLKVDIEGLFDLPERITVPGKKYTLGKGLISYDFFPDKDKLEILFKDDEVGNVYSNNEGCAVLEMPDHTMTSYNFELPYDLDKITFLDGEKNSENYRYEKERRGCGFSCTSFEYVNEESLMPDKRLMIAGTAENGGPIYEIKDPNDKVLKNFYDSYAGSFNNEYETPNDTKKRSYKEFLKLHPLLYWKDPLGRWIEFTNPRFVATPQAEMCKPAIYLYPEEKTELNVQVSPNGGFTYTNPPYDHGWNVIADPNGIVTDLATGKNYDYLYWEGKGLNYPEIKTGWVVKKEDLGVFFDEKLLRLGMNAKETTDFKEYWMKRLSVMPYYEISFLTKDQFDYLAPLSFSPKQPQTLIRIMMTVKGSNNDKQIPEQQLPPTPVRNGFTVVEWGGTLLE